MEIDEYFSKVKLDMQQQLSASKDSIYDKLVGDISSYCNSIPESLFVNYFLPFFIGKQFNDQWVLEWISIAGSPMASVRVFKDGSNETLYFVPSILNANSLMANKGSVDMNSILARYEQYNSNLPIQGVKFLFDALNDKSRELLNNVNLEETNKVWIDIFTRYGLINLEVINNTSNNSSSDDLNNAFEF